MSQSKPNVFGPILHRASNFLIRKQIQSTPTEITISVRFVRSFVRRFPTNLTAPNHEWNEDPTRMEWIYAPKILLCGSSYGL